MDQIKDLKEHIKLIKDVAKHSGLAELDVNIYVDETRRRYNPKINVQINGDNYLNFLLTESETGCGLMILSGIISFTHRKENCETAKLILDKIVEVKLPRVGCLVATLGSSYYKDHEENLVNILGFEEVSEYKNPNMSFGGQKIFIKKINQPKEGEKKEEVKTVVEDVSTSSPSYSPNVYTYSYTQALKAKPIDAITVKRTRKSLQNLR